MEYNVSVRKTKLNTYVCVIKDNNQNVLKEIEIPAYSNERLSLFMAKKTVEILVHFNLI